MWDQQRKLLAKVNRSRNRLYMLPLSIAQPVCMKMCLEDESWRWHARYAHINFGALQLLARDGMVHGLPAIEHADELCEACLAGKQKRTPFPQQAQYWVTRPLELVHGDLCGPITLATPSGKKYFLLLVDDMSRYMWLMLLTSKDEAAAAIKRFKGVAELEADAKLRTLRTDRGDKFTSHDLAVFCANQGVKRHTMTPYSPQQNGVVERRNQTVLAMARSMMKVKGLPSRF
jgi:transposase InsO family protein